MDSIDFNSLSYKIRKPSIDLSLHLPSNNFTQIKLQTQNHLTFEDTQASNGQQQTINPFRRTCHLFKHVQHEKKSLQKSQTHSQKHFSLNKSQFSGTSRSQPYLINVHKEVKQTVTYSLQNFNSFNNNQTKQSKSSIFSNRKCYQTQNQDKFIRIQSSGYQNSDQYSLIMDDFNCQMRTSDIIPKTSQRRIKTQYQENEGDLWETEQISQKNVKMNESKGIFCLTAQQQSSQSTVKQFYFNLKGQKQDINNITKIKEPQNKSNTKKKLKELIYNFVDQLQIIDERQIDPQFYDKLQKCLTFVKKTQKLKQNKQENFQSNTQKWVKYKKSNNLNANHSALDKVNSSRLSTSTWTKNKQNKQNSHPIKQIQTQMSNKYMKIHENNTQESFHGSMKKRKWVF